LNDGRVLFYFKILKSWRWHLKEILVVLFLLMPNPTFLLCFQH